MKRLLFRPPSLLVSSALGTRNKQSICIGITSHPQQQEMHTNSKRQKMPAGVGRSLNNGAIVYKPNFFNNEISRDYFERLLQEIRWQQQSIKVFGRTVKTPRMTSYQAESATLAYTYSGTKHVPDAWHDIVLEIKRQVEQQTSCSFNSCLLNLYRDGRDSVSYHSDSEKEYGE